MRLEADWLDRPALRAVIDALGDAAFFVGGCVRNTLLGEPVAATRAGGPLAQNITRLAECLSEVKRCLAVQDWAALSDVLAFDMDELARSWKRQLIELADQLKPAAS